MVKIRPMTTLAMPIAGTITRAIFFSSVLLLLLLTILS